MITWNRITRRNTITSKTKPYLKDTVPLILLYFNDLLIVNHVIVLINSRCPFTTCNFYSLATVIVNILDSCKYRGCRCLAKNITFRGYNAFQKHSFYYFILILIIGVILYYSNVSYVLWQNINGKLRNLKVGNRCWINKFLKLFEAELPTKRFTNDNVRIHYG